MIRPGIFTRKVVVISLIVAAFVLGVVTARAAQPHMQAALAALQSARQELVAASPYKGGHRDRAIKLVTKAIEEVEKGIAYGERR